jgi:hypothetical protein
MITDLPEPLAVWDCRDDTSVIWRDYLACCRWADEHVADTNRTWRLDFHLIDVPFAVVYRVEERYKWSDRDPVIVVLDELPPAELLH